MNSVQKSDRSSNDLFITHKWTADFKFEVTGKVSWFCL